MKKYRIDYYGWIPGYNDFDYDYVYINAKSKEEAQEKFNELYGNFVKSSEPPVEQIVYL